MFTFSDLQFFSVLGITNQIKKLMFYAANNKTEKKQNYNFN